MSVDKDNDNTSEIEKLSPEQTRTAILHLLNDNEFHSGEALASRLNLSRSAISNHIKVLNELGLPIFSVKGRGYKLAEEIELLVKDKLISLLSASQDTDISNLVSVENVVGSTNDLIKLLASRKSVDAKQSVNSGYCCFAEAQTAGRGRRGRKWVSPYGASLYCSMLWHFDEGYQAMSGLSLMVGVVLNQTLQEFGVETCQLKWPNDLLYEHQKLAGILIEVEGHADTSVSAIIGIGVNIKLPDELDGIDQAFTDINHICADRQQPAISRNVLAATLVKNLWRALPIFERQGLQPFLDSWQQADLYANKAVRLLAGKTEIRGVSRGINASGALLLEVEDSNVKNADGKASTKIEAFHGGEISVRAG